MPQGAFVASKEGALESNHDYRQFVHPLKSYASYAREREALRHSISIKSEVLNFLSKVLDKPAFAHYNQTINTDEPQL